MNKKYLIYTAFTAIILAAGLCGCLSDKAIDSGNSPDWYGVYTGLIPAADCPGIDVEIILRPDHTYEIRYEYLDREDGIFTGKGKFTLDRTEKIITLDAKNFSPYYRVGEKSLRQLDINKKEISGALAENYILKKMY